MDIELVFLNLLLFFYFFCALGIVVEMNCRQNLFFVVLKERLYEATFKTKQKKGLTRWIETKARLAIFLMFLPEMKRKFDQKMARNALINYLKILMFSS